MQTTTAYNEILRYLLHFIRRGLDRAVIFIEYSIEYKPTENCILNQLI